MDHPTNPDDELRRELRRETGPELVEEAAEDEAQTELLRNRMLDLASVAADAAHRGDRATAEMAGTVISGPLIARGTDYLTVRLPDQEADVLLSAAVWSFVPSDQVTGARKTGMSFTGHLKELASAGLRLRLELVSGSPLMGTIQSVGQDHLRVEDPDGRIAYVPTTEVRAVIRSASQQR